MNILTKQVIAMNDIQDKVSYLSNVSALLKENILDTNWIGFYLYKGGNLKLGPFQGKVACTEIEVGKGVCGAAFQRRMLLNINDVHKFEGHIACDSRSNSELVVPLIYQNKCIGVIDMDSESYGRFSYNDEDAIEEIAKVIAEKLCN